MVPRTSLMLVGGALLAVSFGLVVSDVDRNVAASTARAAVRPSMVEVVRPAPLVAHLSATPAEREAVPRAIEMDIGAFSPEATAAAALDAKTQKKVDKLDKKLAKGQSKLSKLEAKDDALGVKIDDLVSQLEAAQQLPEGDAKAAKQKAKLIAKLQKRIAKFEKKSGKLLAKQVKATDKIEGIAEDLEDLDPGHTAGTIEGLELASQMSVVTTDQGGGGGGQGAFAPSGEPVSFPPGSDYEIDEVFAHVWDRAMEPIEMVNMILCFLDLTAYEDMVNRGPYIAQIDGSQCETGKDGSSSGSETGQSAGAQAETPELWTVSSTRGTEQSLQVVKLWIPEDQEGGEGPEGEGGDDFLGEIRIKIVAEEGKSEANPFGQFEMNWAMVEDGGNVNKPEEIGNLATLDVLDGFIGFTLLQNRGDVEQVPELGDFAHNVQANVNMFADQSQGVAHILMRERFNMPDFGGEGDPPGGGEGDPPGGGEGDPPPPPGSGEPGGPGDSGILAEEYVLAFNETHMMRQIGDEEAQCFSRTDFHENAWRYNLYHAEGEQLGERVDQNGGFGFQTAEGFYGWAGFYGIWAPPEADLSTGDVVTQDSFGSDEATQYSVFVAPGRLIRNTQNSLPLADVDGMVFEWFEFPDHEAEPGEPGEGDPPGGDPAGGGFEPSQWRVIYDHATGDWFKTALFDHATHEWTELPELEIEAIDLEAVGGWLGMWSDSLGGSAFFEQGSFEVTYWSESFVDGDDPLLAGGDVSLYGFFDMIGAGIGTDAAETGELFLPPAENVLSPYELLFGANDLTLYLVGESANEAVGLANGVQVDGGPFGWGMRSGPMVTDTNGFLEMDEIWQASEFFTYETGANSWNKFTALVDPQGDFVTFDPPIHFTYKHSVENDSNGSAKGDGQTYLLEYNGRGDLHGIPFHPTDLDGDGSEDRWYPLFTIADGTLMGPNGTEYAIKAVEKELTLQEDPGGCFELNVDTVGALGLPDVSAYQAPDIGSKPELDAAPAVIDGVIQALGETGP